MIRISCVALLACVVPMLAYAEPASPATFTRKELKVLSPQEAAERIFGAVADKVTRIGQKEYFSPTPVTTPQPWLMYIHVEPYYEDYSRLCRYELLEAKFEPPTTDDVAKRGHGASNNDPPAALTAIELNSYFADPGDSGASGKVHCPENLKAYFHATSGSDATLALDTFRSFQKEIAKEKRNVPISCQRMKDAASCDDSINEVLKNATSLSDVEYVTLGPGPQENVGLLAHDTGPKGPFVALRLTLSDYKLTDVKVIADALEQPEMPTETPIVMN